MQLQSYIKESLGKDANTHMFRDRLIWFVDKLVKNNKGAVPFIFDRNEGDYYPYFPNITRFYLSKPVKISNLIINPFKHQF